VARGNDLNGETPFYCEVEGCERRAVRVEGSPVYHYVCTSDDGLGEGHAERMGLWIVKDHEPRPIGTRTMPIAVFDGFSPAHGRQLRAAPLEQLVVALEDALAADSPAEQLGKVRALLDGMRTAAFAEPEEIPSTIAPGF
jgi:hypothetical protein